MISALAKPRSNGEERPCLMEKAQAGGPSSYYGPTIHSRNGFL